VFASVAPGDVAWLGPGAAGASDNVYASTQFTLAVSDEQTEALRATDFPLLVDPDATMTGVVVAIERSEVGSDVRDAYVQLVYQGAVIGESRAVFFGDEWPAVDAVATYGASDDDWNAGLTPFIVNDPTFGVQLIATSQSGAAPVARVDGITMAAHFVPALASVGTPPKLRDRVRTLLRDTDVRAVAFDTPEIDVALADAYTVFRATQMAHAADVPNAFTIQAGANTFALPTSDNDRDSPLEYAGEVRLQRARDGVFMKQQSMAKIEAMRFGLADARRGAPTDYVVWEDSVGTVRGLCYPRAERDEPINLFSRTLADDTRDGVDFDAEILNLSRQQIAAVIYLAAADLAGRMIPEALKTRRLSAQMPARWRSEGLRLAYSARAEHSAMEAIGRTLRMVP
jgi:hypothetical protein